MKRSSLGFILIILFFLYSSKKAGAQNDDNKKSFLGIYYSTKPDSTIHRERFFCSMMTVGFGEKFQNFNSLHQYPWFTRQPGNNLVFFTEEYCFGNPDKLFVAFPVAIGSCTKNTTGNYKDGGYIYNASINCPIGTGGLTLGRRFFSESSSLFLKTIALSAGAIYNYGWIGASIQNASTSVFTHDNYYMGNFQARFQLMFEYPKGYYLISKTSRSRMEAHTLAVKIGYDLPLEPTHWYNPGAFSPGLPPSVNMGGFYFSISLNIQGYVNREMRKEERKMKIGQVTQ